MFLGTGARRLPLDLAVRGDGQDRGDLGDRVLGIAGDVPRSSARQEACPTMTAVASPVVKTGGGKDEACDKPVPLPRLGDDRNTRLEQDGDVAVDRPLADPERPRCRPRAPATDPGGGS